MKPYLRPIDAGSIVAGAAVTVSCDSGDNLMLHAALEVCQPGDVIIVSPSAESTHGMFGSLLGTSCQALGIAAVVIDAGVRDVRDLMAMRFPVWAKVICAEGPSKAAAGSVNVPVVCGGAVVHPGDVIVADFDGVVVIPAKEVTDVAEAAEKRQAQEQRDLIRLGAGELTIDLYGFRPKLKELGVVYVD